MKKNVGYTDKILRILVGLAVIIIGSVMFHKLWGLFGILPILTAAFEYCPLYSFLRVNTCCRKGEGAGPCCGG